MPGRSSVYTRWVCGTGLAAHPGSRAAALRRPAPETSEQNDDLAARGEQAFAGDPVPTAAMLDRLLDHSTVVAIQSGRRKTRKSGKYRRIRGRTYFPGATIRARIWEIPIQVKFFRSVNQLTPFSRQVILRRAPTNGASNQASIWRTDGFCAIASWRKLI